MLSNNKKTLFIVGIWVFATVAGAVLSWFLFDVVSSESTDVKTAETSIAILEAKTRDLERAKDGLVKNAEALSAIQKSFISEENFVDFVKLLEYVGRAAGVKLQVNNAELPDNGGTVRVFLDATGSYEEIVRFIMLIDGIPYPSIVSNLSIVPEIAGRNDPLRAAIRLDVFNFRTQ